MADELQIETTEGAAVASDIPQYVFDHAPLVYLSSKDPYLPSSISTHLQHTRPQIAFADTSIPSPPLSPANLDQLNAIGNGGTDVFLTSFDDVSASPKWIQGIRPGADGGTGAEKTSVIVVVDKGDLDGKAGGKGVVDVFYFYFWSFNWGGVVLGNQLGDHVGDWEHNMIRFIGGVPKYVWYSQHANGEAFTFECLKKDQSGKRPIVYAANGSHALYPTTGPHDHTIPNFNLPIHFILVDETDVGPLFDPLLSSYFYTSPPQSTTFTPYNATDPVSYLYFKGRWGDAEYPATDRRQKALFGNKKYVGGPTGPADKQIGRREVWPESSFSKGQKIRTSLGLEGFGEKVGAFFQKANCCGGRAKKVKRVKVSGEPA